MSRFLPSFRQSDRSPDLTERGSDTDVVASWGSGPVLLIAAVLVGLTVFGIWASNSMIDELARARGQVIALARTQIVQAADDGVLSEMFVEEGQTVSQGQLLVRMEQDRGFAMYEDSLNKVAALQASLARLRAEVFGKELAFPADLSPWPTFVENQKQLFLRRKQALNEALAALQETKSLIVEELAMTEPLLVTGDIGKTEVLRLRRSLAEVTGQMINIRNRFFQDAQVEMTKTEEELAAQEQLLRERTAILGYTEIRAPADGIVRKIEVTTTGASVRKGQALIELLPVDSELIVEAEFSPADVASLRIGQKAAIKLDAWDASIYGSVDGEVIYLSPDALSRPDQRGGEQPFYRVHVRPGEPPSEVGPRRETITIDPGMTATIEVRTRDRSVLSYLTKPVTKTLSNAFGER